MTFVPDYISPIIGYRAWQWDRGGIRSLNGTRWRPGKPLDAGCGVCDFAAWRRSPKSEQRSHSAPQLDCTCGIYASKTLEHLRRPGYERLLIYGEVLLWGMVVEHEYGWRAQFAYPKTFFFRPEVLPITLMELHARLETLISYERDIVLFEDHAMSPLWNRDSGFTSIGLDYLLERARRWYTRRSQASAIC